MSDFLVTPWSIAGQAPLTSGFPRQEYWSGLPFPSPGHLPHPGIENESEVAQSCPNLCNHMDCSLPGSSIHGILQARTLEWVAISFSRGSSQPRDRTQVSCLVGRHFTIWATREAPVSQVVAGILYCWAIGEAPHIKFIQCPLSIVSQ